MITNDASIYNFCVDKGNIDCTLIITIITITIINVARKYCTRINP